MDRLVPTLVGVLLLCGVSTAVLHAAGVPQRFGPVLAVVRAAVQLAAIGLVLTGVITSPLWVAVALLVMFSVASGTAARRLGGRRRLPAVAGSIAAGTKVALGVVFASGALEPSPRYLLAIGGIVVGNAMAITILASRRFLEAADEHWDEVEGWLALGAPPRDATRGLARRAVHTALVPTVDQTRTTGLVTLPGGFVARSSAACPRWRPAASRSWCWPRSSPPARSPRSSPSARWRRCSSVRPRRADAPHRKP